MARRILTLLAIVALVVASKAYAAAQRTFVSTAGSDINPCSLPQPCRTFNAAVAQASDGGEVIVLDSGGYGTATIIKSISIIAPPGVYAGVSVFAGPGVLIGGAGISVTLRGLTITGLGGSSGVYVLSASEVFVDQCVITGMSDLAVQGGTAGYVSIADSVLSGNGGVAGGGTNLTLNRVRAEHTSGTALRLLGPGHLVIRDSLFSGGIGGFLQFNAYGSSTPHIDIVSTTFVNNGGPGLLFTANDISEITVNIRDSTIIATSRGITLSGQVNASIVGNLIADNLYGGILIGGPGTVIATGNSLPRNLFGIDNAGGTLLSTGNNVTEGNATPVIGTIGTAQQN